MATKQFRECANLLQVRVEVEEYVILNTGPHQAVNELSSYFDKYKGVPKIAELNQEVQTARDALIQLVNYEFTQERSQVCITAICIDLKRNASYRLFSLLRSILRVSVR